MACEKDWMAIADGLEAEIRRLQLEVVRLEGELRRSGNYVADDPDRPRQVKFNDGRRVFVAAEGLGDAHLVVDWSDFEPCFRLEER